MAEKRKGHSGNCRDGGRTLDSGGGATAGRWRTHAQPMMQDSSYALQGEQASSAGSFVFSLVVFGLTFCVVFFVGSALSGGFSLIVLLVVIVVSILAAMSMHIAFDWERAVVMRLGAFSHVAGPGFYFVIPVIDQVAMSIDMRIRVTPIVAEETLSSDLVPLDVDAVLFWMVYDAHAACTEISGFSASVSLAAQAALRDAIGRACASEVTMRREQLDKELKRMLADQVGAWGIEITDVKVRDIRVPKELQDVMSREAQAEQKRKARITLMEAEQDVFDMLGDISAKHGGDQDAMRIRAMHLLYESVSDTGGTVVIPSSFSEGFGDIFPEDVAERIRKDVG